MNEWMNEILDEMMNHRIDGFWWHLQSNVNGLREYFIPVLAKTIYRCKLKIVSLIIIIIYWEESNDKRAISCSHPLNQIPPQKFNSFKIIFLALSGNN